MLNRRGRILCAVAIFALGTPCALEAQIQRMRSVDGTTVGLEAAKVFISDSDLSWYSSVVRGRMLRPAGENGAILVDWGISMAGYPGGSDATILNPEVGLALVDENDEMKGYLSVILPLAQEIGDDDASVGIGFLTDFSWPDRFTDQLWSVNAGLTRAAALGSDAAMRGNAELVGSVLIPRNGGDTEAFARYAVGLSRDTETVRVRADLVGLAILSEGDLSISERTLHELVLGVSGLSGGPGGFLKVPLDDQFDGVDLVLGLTYTF